MKYIWLGIKDYIKDWWHDWLIRRLFKLFYKDKPHKLPDLWKEGSIWHYIQQRKAAKLLKEIKRLKEELNN